MKHWRIKQFTLVLTAVFCLFLTACGSVKNVPTESPKVDTEAATQSESSSRSAGNGQFSVVFIIPGLESEEYWRMQTAFMVAAAKDLDIDLEVFYADRDHMRMVNYAKEVCLRKVKPNYMVVVNEKSMAPEMIKAADQAGIKTLLILNDLTKEQKVELGSPREKYPNWLGTFIPDNSEAGYLIAESVIGEAEKNLQGNIQMLAISGSRSTPAAMEREAGLMKSLEQHPKVELKQLTYGEWEETKGYEQAKGLLDRYPEVGIIWAANDLMATGALKVVKERDRKPGHDVYISGLNWSQPALGAIRNGEMVSSVGGHFMVGGWSLVILYDYHNGSDFKDSEGSNILVSVFGVIDNRNLESYSKYFGGQNWERIDFGKFSKKLNSELKDYEFSLDVVFQQMQ